MATKKKPEAQASCCGGHSDACCGRGNWYTGLKLWWAVTWRTALWISLPLLLVQFALAYVQNPAILNQLYFTALMMLGGASSALKSMLVEPAFWFFISVSVFTFLGRIYVYGRLAETGLLQRIADGK